MYVDVVSANNKDTYAAAASAIKRVSRCLTLFMDVGQLTSEQQKILFILLTKR